MISKPVNQYRETVNVKQRALMGVLVFSSDISGIEAVSRPFLCPRCFVVHPLKYWPIQPLTSAPAAPRKHFETRNPDSNQESRPCPQTKLTDTCFMDSVPGHLIMG